MNKEIIKKAAEYFGKEHQTSKAIEELSELSIELSKAINNAADVDHIAEEIADVMIMCEQLMVLYNNEEQVKRMTAFKLGRLDLNIRYLEHCNVYCKGHKMYIYETDENGSKVREREWI